MPNFYQHLVDASAGGRRFALGIISDIKGSSPQKRGAKALFFEDGTIIGTLGGGCLEAEVQDRARRTILSGDPATFELVLDHDFGWDDGLICGGKVCGLILPNAAEKAELWRALASREREVGWSVSRDFVISESEIESENESVNERLYHETVAAACLLWIAGSGHVAQAVAPLAQRLDFEVTVFDDRPALACHRYFPKETQFRVGEWSDILAEPFPAQKVFGLIVTRGHQRDAFVLSRWVSLPFTFLGMIGSRRKKRMIFDQMIKDRFATLEQLAGIACPVGIDIQSRTVPEIGISIAAQLIERRSVLLSGHEPSRVGDVMGAKARTEVVGP